MTCTKSEDLLDAVDAAEAAGMSSIIADGLRRALSETDIKADKRPYGAPPKWAIEAYGGPGDMEKFYGRTPTPGALE